MTQRELVLARDGTTLASTVEAPPLDLEPGETVDLELPEGEFRAHLVPLDDDDGEWLLLLGPRKEGGFLAIDRSTVALLLGFLMIAIVLAYALARTLTGLHSQVAEQAITDPLTGLWNRRRMDRGVAQEVDRSLRFGHHLSVLIVDVDDFKRINDELGHPTGDMVLRRIADVVRSTTRSIDFTARYGGDELALILLETGPQGAAVLAERLRTNVREKRILGRDGTRAVTISVGVATLPDSAGDPASLIEAADQALLAAKRAGKDQTRSAPGRPRPRAPAGEGPRGRGERGGNGRLGSGVARPASCDFTPVAGTPGPGRKGAESQPRIGINISVSAVGLNLPHRATHGTMGILDDAIREHLDLKRKHGARDSELTEIEDEAFGSGDRPDPFAAGELFGGTEGPPRAAPDSPSEEPTMVVEPQASAPSPAAEAPPAEPPPIELPPEPPAPPDPGSPEPPPAPSGARPSRRRRSRLSSPNPSRS